MKRFLILVAGLLAIFATSVSVQASDPILTQCVGYGYTDLTLFINAERQGWTVPFTLSDTVTITSVKMPLHRMGGLISTESSISVIDGSLQFRLNIYGEHPPTNAALWTSDPITVSTLTNYGSAPPATVGNPATWPEITVSPSLVATAGTYSLSVERVPAAVSPSAFRLWRVGGDGYTCAGSSYYTARATATPTPRWLERPSIDIGYQILGTIGASDLPARLETRAGTMGITGESGKWILAIILIGFVVVPLGFASRFAMPVMVLGLGIASIAAIRFGWIPAWFVVVMILLSGLLLVLKSAAKGSDE